MDILFRILILIVAGFSFAANASAVINGANSKNMPTGQYATKIVQVTGKKLITPSAAARIAQGVSPSSKLLNVRLSGERTPRYVVKVRNKGRLQTIEINAKTGSVMRR